MLKLPAKQIPKLRPEIFIAIIALFIVGLGAVGGTILAPSRKIQTLKSKAALNNCSPNCKNDFQIGWWIERNALGDYKTLDSYYSQGSSFVNLSGALCFNTSVANSLAKTIQYLEEAQRLGMKAVVGLVCKGGTPNTWTATDFKNAIGILKNYPALYAYYIADGPDGNTTLHDYLLTNPGYYKLIKQVDSIHPVYISFSSYWSWSTSVKPFYDVTDIVGLHNYPKSYNMPEWSELGVYDSYDIWKVAFTDAIASGKTDFIATMQGFGANNPRDVNHFYGTMTLAEGRYQLFSAIVQGIKRVFFWKDLWGQETGYTNQANSLMQEAQEIGAQMNSGVTSDPRITVSLTDRNQLAYRYGEANAIGALLAVNIANRTLPPTLAGSALTNVKFTLPPSVTATTVNVLNENGRTIPIINGTFIDSFTKFQVHIYTFQTRTPSPPPVTIPPGGSKPGDANGDNRVDGLDYVIWRNHFNQQVFGPTLGDFNSDNIVDGLDYVTWLNNFGR